MSWGSLQSLILSQFLKFKLSPRLYVRLSMEYNVPF